MHRVLTAAILPLIALPLASVCSGEEVSVDFVRDVRPIFQQHCDDCHGSDHQVSGLRLDIRAEAFAGGDGYGEAIVPGDPESSPLIQLVRGDEADVRMPPDGEGLTADELAVLTQWIAAGAAWPEGVDTATVENRRDHWSFQPLVRPAVPPVDAADGWSRQPIDRFVLARLHAEGLQPAPPAADAQWLRRVTLDLTGLPPTPEEVAAFVAQCDQPAARERAYPQAVDRLLHSPRYGERWAQHWLDVVRYADTHGFEVNTERPHAWPYRDYVISALNADTPYDRFVREQIAGDQMGAGAATGFLVTASVLLPGQIGKDEASKRLARQDALDEIVNNISHTFLGLSVGCARCHDHMFDPISHRDYYAMQAMVAGVEYGDRPLHTAEANEQRLVAFAGVFRTPDVIHRLMRGDPEQPRESMDPGVMELLGKADVPAEAGDEQRRTALADWIARVDNPLTARVMANRVWQGHFGIGLVDSPNDFGRAGSLPSHPELLDYLAAELIRSQWSIKSLHRMITLSATYRQSTRPDRAAAAIDADVRLLWRYPPRRLEAEAIRDSVLAASGQLHQAMGGPGFDLFDKRGGLTGFEPRQSFAADGLRRMIYAHKVRRERDAVFGAFDCPDGGQSAARRRESTTPIQALNLFNSQFILDQAQAMAQRVTAEVGPDRSAQIHRAYQLTLGRDPEPQELRDAQPVVAQHGLATLARVLFNSNEFLFLP